MQRIGVDNRALKRRFSQVGQWPTSLVQWLEWYFDMFAPELRDAHAGDEGAIVDLLREAALCQGVGEEFSLNPSLVKQYLLDPGATAHCLFTMVAGEAVGLALWFWTYRSFRGQRGLFLEDLYVRSTHRRKGLGKLMLAHLAEIASADGAFMEWAVFDWNIAAQDFYRRLGGLPKPELIGFRLDGKELQNLVTEVTAWQHSVSRGAGFWGGLPD